MAVKITDPHDPLENHVPYVYHEYPKCLYKGPDESRVVQDKAGEAKAKADGYGVEKKKGATNGKDED